MTGFTLAHLSDLHLPMELDRLSWRHYPTKRLISFISWHRKRKHRHRPEVLAAMIADIMAAAPDHIAVTGDIANLALPAEFVRALSWLDRLGPADRVTLVPGNHDMLVPVAHGHGLGHWRDFMAGDDAGLPGAVEPGTAEAFPFLRERGDIALIGVNSSLPTSPLLASGRVGQRQLDRLEHLLRRLGEARRCRIVLIHHPVAQGVASRRKGLSDAAEVRAVLARAGAELVLHGHSHRPIFAPVSGPHGPIATIGVPAASAVDTPRDPQWGARWHLFTIARTAEGWHLTVTARRRDGVTGRFVTIGEFVVAAPQPRAAAAQ